MQVAATPAVYQFFFNNPFLYPDYQSTVAKKLAEFTSVPSFEVTDAFQFLKFSNNEYRETGYGINLAGVPLPVQYQQIDTLYRFPIVYGDVDSSHSLFQAGVPDLGYLLIQKTRRNFADAWGTLTTPYGTFETLRVRTEIVEYDSLFVDSLGMGMPLTRNITEYKWLSDEFPEPLLQITEEGFAATAVYLDSVRTSSLGTQELNPGAFTFSVYPNPSTDYITVNYELTKECDVRLSLFSVYGNELKRFAQTRQEKGLYNRVLYLQDYGVNPGIYLLRLTVDNVPYIKRILLK